MAQNQNWYDSVIENIYFRFKFSGPKEHTIFKIGILNLRNYGMKLTYVLHFLGMTYPSRPGFTGRLGITLRHERHCMDIFVAFALIPDADITIPGIFTSLDTVSD